MPGCKGIRPVSGVTWEMTLLLKLVLKIASIPHSISIAIYINVDTHMYVEKITVPLFPSFSFLFLVISSRDQMLISPKTCREPLVPGKCCHSATFQGGLSPRVGIADSLLHQKLNKNHEGILDNVLLRLGGTWRTISFPHLLCHNCSGKSSLGDFHSRYRTGLVQW